MGTMTGMRIERLRPSSKRRKWQILARLLLWKARAQRAAEHGRIGARGAGVVQERQNPVHARASPFMPPCDGDSAGETERSIRSVEQGLARGGRAEPSRCLSSVIENRGDRGQLLYPAPELRLGEPVVSAFWHLKDHLDSKRGAGFRHQPRQLRDRGARAGAARMEKHQQG